MKPKKNKKSFKVMSLLAVLYVMLSLSIPILAADMPENTVSGSLTINDISIQYTGSTLNIIPDLADTIDVSYGTFNLITVLDLSSNTIENVPVQITFTLDQAAAFYIPYYVSITTTSTPEAYLCNITGLEDYYYNSSQPSYSGEYTKYSITMGGVVTPSSGTGTMVIGFNIYTSVPAGTYTITVTPSTVISSGSIKSNTVPVGFYLSTSIPGTEAPADPVNDYINGTITYDEAVQQIKDQMNAVLDDSTSTDFEKQMALADAQAKLEELKDASDVKYNTVVREFASSTEELVNDFITSGSTDPDPYIQNLQTLYTDALTQATTPEQGTFINTQFHIALDQIQTVWEANYKSELDDVVSDEQMQAKDEEKDKVYQSIEKEQEAIDIFEQADYESQLLFEMWTNQLTDAEVYRSIFEYLIEDENSVFRLYIQVPIALVIVSVLLATTTVVMRRYKGG